MTNQTKLTAGVLAGLFLILVSLAYRSIVPLEPLPDARPELGHVAHGIETSWHSASGGHRLWSLSDGLGDFHPWIAEHVAAFKTAQEALPKLEER